MLDVLCIGAAVICSTEEHSLEQDCQMDTGPGETTLNSALFLHESLAWASDNVQYINAHQKGLREGLRMPVTYIIVDGCPLCKLRVHRAPDSCKGHLHERQVKD